VQPNPGCAATCRRRTPDTGPTGPGHPLLEEQHQLRLTDVAAARHEVTFEAVDLGLVGRREERRRVLDLGEGVTLLLDRRHHLVEAPITLLRCEPEVEHGLAELADTATQDRFEFADRVGEHADAGVHPIDDVGLDRARVCGS
jgi:hypothetical protein